MKNSKIFAALGLVVTMAAPMTAFAADAVNPQNGETKVTLNVEADYNVRVPAAIELEYQVAEDAVFNTGSVYAKDYEVTVNGFLPMTTAVEITTGDVTMKSDEHEFVVSNYLDVDKDAKKSAGNVITVSGAELEAAGNIDITVTDADGKETTETLEHAISTASRFEKSAQDVEAGNYQGTASFTYKLVAAE